MRFLLWRRQATSAPGASVMIVVIVVLAAVILTAWPRMMERTFIEEAEYQMATAPVTHQAVTGELRESFASATQIQQTLDEIVQSAGPQLSEVLAPPRFSLTSDAGYSITPPAGIPVELSGVGLRLRQDQDIDDYVRMVEGSAPEISPQEESLAQGRFDELTEEPTEFMLAAPAAQQAGLNVGDELELPGYFFDMSLRLSGTFEALDPADPQWQHQLSSAEPLLVTDPDRGDTLHMIGYVHPENTSWLGVLGTMQVEMWLRVEPQASETADLLADLRTITAAEYPLPDDGERTLSLESPLVGVLTNVVNRWRGTASILDSLAAGPLGVLAAVLALTAQLAVARRRDALALTTARGGSPVQVRGALVAEGLVLGVPAAVAGAVLATVVVPGPAHAGHYAGAGALSLAPALLLGAASLPSLRTSRADLSPRSTHRLRWVLEALVIGVAGAGVYLVLDRGLVAADRDLLGILTPLLLAVAAAVIALRLLPVPLLVAHRALRRRRSLAGFLGSARAIREQSVPWAPILALLVGISIAVFSTVMISTLRTGVQDAALAEAGADVRISGPVLDEETLQEVAEIPGVATVAPVATLPNSRLASGTTGENLTLLAADTQALRQVQTGVPGAVTLPEGMAEPDAEGRAPAVLSPTDLDGEVRLVMNPSMPLQVVGTSRSATGLTTGSRWALVDLEVLRDHTGRPIQPRLALIELTADADSLAVVGALETVTGAVVSSPAASLETLTASPSATSLERGFATALGLTLALCILAVVLNLILAAPARGRLIAVLRTLGAETRVSRRLVAWEILPLVAVACVVGTALGLILPALLAQTVDLRPFTGGAVQPALVYPGRVLLAVVAGSAAVLTGCVLVAAGIAQRLSLSVLRIGDAT